MGAPAQLLAKAWEHLRLAEKAPLRHPSWDAILVTAASNAQVTWNCNPQNPFFGNLISPFHDANLHLRMQAHLSHLVWDYHTCGAGVYVYFIETVFQPLICTWKNKLTLD